MKRYAGRWKMGKMHGQGFYTWADGKKYQGRWRDNKRNGIGTCTYPNGNKFHGEWKDDKRHGQVSVSLSLSLCLSVCLSIYLYLCVFVCVCFSVTLSLSLSLSLFLSLFLSFLNHALCANHIPTAYCALTSRVLIRGPTLVTSILVDGKMISVTVAASSLMSMGKSL